MKVELEKYRNEYLSLNLIDNINYEKFSIISIVYNSTKIEGCSLDESDTRSLLEQLCQTVNEKIDAVSGIEILNLAADLHYNLVNIHPWGDGNGRVSRLMMNYIQMYHNEPLIKIFTEDLAEYISALNETEKANNPEIFRDFIASQQIKFFKAEIEKFKKKDDSYSFLF